MSVRRTRQRLMDAACCAVGAAITRRYVYPEPESDLFRFVVPSGDIC